MVFSVVLAIWVCSVVCIFFLYGVGHSVCGVSFPELRKHEGENGEEKVSTTWLDDIDRIVFSCSLPGVVVSFAASDCPHREKEPQVLAGGQRSGRAAAKGGYKKQCKRILQTTARE